MANPNHPVNGRFQTPDIPDSAAAYDTSGGNVEVSKAEMEQGYTVEPPLPERFNPSNDQQYEAPITGGFLGRPEGWER